MALDSSSNHAADPPDGPPADPHGPVVYPACDDMVETGYHNFTIHLLIELFESYFAALGRPVFVRGNQFFYYRKGDPRAAVAPDVYTVDDEERHATRVDSWKTWEPGDRPPTFALEIVSDAHRKDYSDKFLERYQELGVRELVRYDPAWRGRRKRELFAHFVREEQGQLTRRPVFGDRVRLVSYDLWLVPHLYDTLRLGLGPNGAVLWPRAAERAAEAEAARAAETVRAAEAEAAYVAEVARAEAARAAEAERAAAAEAARTEAEAEVARLRALLAGRGE